MSHNTNPVSRRQLSTEAQIINESKSKFKRAASVEKKAPSSTVRSPSLKKGPEHSAKSKAVDKVRKESPARSPVRRQLKKKAVSEDHEEPPICVGGVCDISRMVENHKRKAAEKVKKVASMDEIELTVGSDGHLVFSDCKIHSDSAKLVSEFKKVNIDNNHSKPKEIVRSRSGSRKLNYPESAKELITKKL